jgi:hypothetical protein
MSNCRPATSNVMALVVKPKDACRMLNCGNTRLYELLGVGKLDSFLDGRSRKITVESIHRYIACRLKPDSSLTGSTAQPSRCGRPGKSVGTVARTQLSPRLSQRPHGVSSRKAGGGGGGGE